jgi:hypothetical protein
MVNTIASGDLTGLFEFAANQGNDFDAIDLLDTIKVLDTEGARTSERNMNGFAHLLSFQDEVADRRVAGRYVIEAVPNVHPMGRIGDIAHRATRDQPHDQFNPFRTRLAHVINMWDTRRCRGIGDQLVHKVLIEGFVD